MELCWTLGLPQPWTLQQTPVFSCPSVRGSGQVSAASEEPGRSWVADCPSPRGGCSCEDWGSVHHFQEQTLAMAGACHHCYQPVEKIENIIICMYLD